MWKQTTLGTAVDMEPVRYQTEHRHRERRSRLITVGEFLLTAVFCLAAGSWIVGCSGSPGTPVETAKKLIDQGESVRAIKILDKVIARDDRNVQVPRDPLSAGGAVGGRADDFLAPRDPVDADIKEAAGYRTVDEGHSNPDPARHGPVYQRRW